MNKIFIPDYPGRGVYIIPGIALVAAIAAVAGGDWAGAVLGFAFLWPALALAIWLKKSGLYLDDEGISRGSFGKKNRILWKKIERVKLAYCTMRLFGSDEKGRWKHLEVAIHAKNLRDKTDLQKVELMGRYLSPYFDFSPEIVLERREPPARFASDSVPASTIERRSYWRIYSYGLIALWLAGATWTFVHLSDFENEKSMRKVLLLSPFAAAFALALPQAIWRKGREDRLAKIYGYERLGWQMRKGSHASRGSCA